MSRSNRARLFAKSSYARRLCAERLEDRRMLTTLVVQNTLDGDLATLAGDGELSLREAIHIANTGGTIDGFTSASAADTIEFDPATFTGGAASLIRLTAGELVIRDTLMIDGSMVADATITGDADGDDVVDANFVTDVAASLANDPASLDDNSRVLNFSASSGDLSLNGITISGGRTREVRQDGGGIRFRSSGSLSVVQSTVSGNSTSGDDSDGGGIAANGLQSEVIVENSAVNGNATSGRSSSGGGISVGGVGGSFEELGAANLILTGTTVSGNSTAGGSGGGIFAGTGGNVALTDSAVNGNTAGGSGGGIFARGGGGILDNKGGNISLSHSTVSNNTAGGSGGGISAGTGGNVTLASSTVSGNSTSGGSGGGIYARGGGGILDDRGGNVSLSHSTVSGNSTSGEYSRGGGIATGRGGGITLTDSTVSGNSTSGRYSDGGGIYTRSGGIADDKGGNVSLNRSTVSGNNTSGERSDGGGISVGRGGDVFLFDSTVSGNSTSGENSDGGGIFANGRGGIFGDVGANVRLSSSTVSGNSTSGQGSDGGGVFVYQANNVSLLNTILAGNTAPSTPDLRLRSGSITTIEFSLIGDTAGSGISGTSGVGNFLDVDPLLGPLADNEGPTFTHALLPNSPAIDAGSSTSATDQRGVQRIVDVIGVPNGSGNAADIGAFEFVGLSVAGGFPPPEVTVFFDTPTEIDLSAGQIVDESGSAIAVTLTADAGEFTQAADGSGVGAGVTATLSSPQAVTLVGSAADLNAYFNDVSNLFYMAPAGSIGPTATIAVAINSNPVGAINVNVVELPSFAVTITNDLVDPFDQETSLREAIALANNTPGDDTVSFDPTAFTGGADSLTRLTDGELEITDTLTIDGSTGVGITISGDADGDDVVDSLFITEIAASFGGTVGDANDLLDDNSRVFNFSVATGDLTLEGITVTGGRTRSFDQDGGGIRFVGNGLLSILQSTISGNSTTGSSSAGGGIYATSVRLTNSTVNSNSTLGRDSDGGGIFTSSGNATLNSSTLSNNSTSGYSSSGGGIYARSVTITTSTLSGNSTSGDNSDGGGISTASGSVTLSGSTVNDNGTSGRNSEGGGIHSVAGDVVITSSTISGNSTLDSGSEGGGIYTASGNVTLTDSTVTENSSELSTGGGVFVLDTSNNPAFALHNTIIAGNTGGAASDLRADPDSFVDVHFSLIGDTAGTAIDEATGIGNLLNVDPLLGPLADNGGPTATHALMLESPAIDFGSSTSTADQRGLTRPLDLISLPDGLGNQADIGAFEFQAPLTPSAWLPERVHALLETPSDLDLSASRIIDESGSLLTVTLTASAGEFSEPADGPGISASLIEPRTVALAGFVQDLNAYLADLSNLGYTAAVVGPKAGTILVSVDSTPLGSIDIDVAEVPGLVVTTEYDLVDEFDLRTSLREAIALANALLGPDTIEFDPTVFSGGFASLIRLNAGELEITDTLTIDGSTGVGVTISGDVDGDDVLVGGSFVTDLAASLEAGSTALSDNSRVLSFSGQAGDLTLLDLTITGGRTSATNDEGAGIRFRSDGTLFLSRSTISGNTTTGRDSEGAGVFTSSGSVTLTQSTISGNSTTGFSSQGGGVYTASGAVTINDSTITENASGYSSGSGVYVRNTDADPAFTVRNSIIAGNVTRAFPDGQRTAEVRLDPDSALDIRFGLFGVTSGVIIDPNNGIGNLLDVTNPRLGPLTDNGGPSPTHSLLPGSPAIDAGEATLSTDQRGLGRPVDLSSLANGLGDGSDIGAFELQPTSELSVFFPESFDLLFETPSEIDLSASQIIEESGSLLTLTLIADSGEFSPPVDGADAGVSAILLTQQTITLTGSAADLNTYLGDRGSLQYAPAPGAIGVAAATVVAAVDSTPVGVIEVNVLELPSLTVTTASDVVDPFDQETSLREAIAFANRTPGANTVEFASAVFTGDAASLLRLTNGEIEITDTLTINASTGIDILITGDRLGNDALVPGTFVTDVEAAIATDPTSLDDNSRVLSFSANEGDLTLLDLTITGGRTVGGRFPFAAEGNGGGIGFLSEGSLAISNSSISGNVAADADFGVSRYLHGGGIFSIGSVALNDSVISGNQVRASRFSISHQGGGVYSEGPVTLNQSTVRNNQVVGSDSGFPFGRDYLGGGIATSAGDITVVGSEVSDNTSRGAGGGVYTGSGLVTLVNSTLSGNSSGGSGGGAYSRLGGVSLTNSTVSGNFSEVDGGGIYSQSGIVSLIGSTITNNDSNQTGGGFYIRNTTGDPAFTLLNSIIAGNTGNSSAPDLRTDPESFLDIRFSLIGDTLGSNVSETTGVGNLLNVDPLLDPLANNGGQTLTHALLTGSLAIDAGDPDFVTNGGVDQRGNPFVRIADGRVDLGAFEVQATPMHAVGDYNRDGRVDAADYTVWRDTLDPEVPVTPLSGADGDGDGFVTQNDRTIWVSHFNYQFSSPVPSIAGDYNRDGSVNAADYTVWRDALDPEAPVTPFSGADGDGDGFVTADDHAVWVGNFGFGLPSPNEASASLVAKQGSEAVASVPAQPIAQPAVTTVASEIDERAGEIETVLTSFVVSQSTEPAAQSTPQATTSITEPARDGALLLLALEHIEPQDEIAPVEALAIDEALSEGEPGEPEANPFATLFK